MAPGRTLAPSSRSRAALSLRSEERDEADEDRILMFARSGSAPLEERLVRPIVPVFEPRKETLFHLQLAGEGERGFLYAADRKSTRLNSSHRCISYAVFCLKKKRKTTTV